MNVSGVNIPLLNGSRVSAKIKTGFPPYLLKAVWLMCTVQLEKMAGFPPMSTKIAVAAQDGARYAAGPSVTTEIFGLPLHPVSLSDAADMMREACLRPTGSLRLMVHINANNLSLLMEQESLMRSLSSGATMFMDGIGLKLVASVLGKGWLPDINGTDLFPHVMKMAASENVRVYFLGGGPGVAARACARVAKQFGTCVALVGSSDGYFATDEEGEICARISASGADLLLIGMGCPYQEAFALRNRDRLSVRVIWTVGGLLDVLAGRHPRAPLVLRKLRLEWLFRWCVEPKAKAHRTWVRHPRLLATAVKYRYFQ